MLIEQLLSFFFKKKAKRLFISHHVFGDSPVLHYMKSFWPPSPNDKYLTFAVRAVSLAYLSSEVRSPDVLQQARKTYGSALALTNKALHSQDIALKNGTLLTVLLLDLFENLTNDEPTSTASATKHLDGALALLKLRGNAQFQDAVSLAMFQHLSSSLIPSCLERGIAIPKVYLRFRSQAARFVDTNDPDWRLSDLMIQLAKLRASLKESKPASTQAIATAQYLDLEFLDINNTMPQSSDLKTRSSQSPSSENSDNRPSQAVDRERNLRLVRALLDETLSKLSPDPA